MQFSNMPKCEILVTGLALDASYTKTYGLQGEKRISCQALYFHRIFGGFCFFIMNGKKYGSKFQFHFKEKLETFKMFIKKEKCLYPIESFTYFEK